MTRSHCSLFSWRGQGAPRATRGVRRLTKAWKAQPLRRPVVQNASAAKAMLATETTEATSSVRQVDGVLDLLAAAELGVNRAIQDYIQAQQEEGGLLPRQWLQESPLKLQASTKRTEKQTVELALIQCVGVIKADRKQPKEILGRWAVACWQMLELSRSAARDLEALEANEAFQEEDEEEAEDEERDEYEEQAAPRHDMILTVDLSKWNGDSSADELVVGDFDLDDHDAIRPLATATRQRCEALLATQHMEDVMRQDQLPDLKLTIGIAFGLRALQRASMKHQLRTVGLCVLETERKAEDPPPAVLQPVLLISAAERRLRRRAEADDEFLGGFVRSQFNQKGPVQRKPYAYRPYFQPPAPEIDPAALMTSAERKFLVKLVSRASAGSGWMVLLVG
eukprot:Skav221041  [mRNA]  locus=scaffold1448:186330:196505:+ [translate_table: standard]